MDGDIRLRSADCLDRIHRDAAVLAAEMHQNRAFRRLVPEIIDLAAIIADRGGDAVQPRRRQPGQRATPAIAGDAGLQAGQCPGGRLDIEKRSVPIHPPLQFPSGCNVVGVVAQLHPTLDPVEQGRGDRLVSIRREPVGHGADVRIDAENFLDDNDPAARFALGFRDVGVQFMPVGSL